MATNYEINLTDQVRKFSIAPYTTNGPKNPQSATPDSRASTATTTLILYGKGTTDYGENTAESLVHLLENFSGTVEPVFPISGQEWLDRNNTPAQLRIYDMMKHGIVPDPDNLLDDSWFAIPFNNAEDKAWILARLQGDDTQFRLRIHTAAGDQEEYIIPALSPNAAISSDPTLIHFQVSPVPSASRTGGDWWYGDWTYEVQNDAPLHSDLHAGVDPDNGSGYGYSILNLRNPVDPQDAATMWYVDSEVANAIANNNELGELIDVTITTPVLNEILVYDGAGQWVNSVGTSVFLSIDGGTLTGPLTIAGGSGYFLDMDGNPIRNLLDPTLPQDAATKIYVDNATVGVSLELDDLTNVTVTEFPPSDDLMIWDFGGGSNQWVNITPDDFVTKYGLVTSAFGAGEVTTANAAQFITDNLILTTAGGAAGGSGVYLTEPFSIISPYAFTNDQFVNKNYVDTQISLNFTEHDGVVAGGTYDNNTPQSISLQREIAGVPGSLPDVVIDLTGIKDIDSTTLSHEISNPNDISAFPFVPSKILAWDQAFFNLVNYPTVSGDNLFKELNTMLGTTAQPKERLLFQSAGLSVVNLGPGSVTDQTNPVLTNTSIEYPVGTNKLSVFVNGIKNIASESGYRDVTSDTVNFNLWPGTYTGLTINEPDLPITGLNVSPRDFVVVGDFTPYFTIGSTFTVSGSTGNDGTYTVASSTFDATNTIIRVDEFITSPIVDGVIVLTPHAILSADNTAETFTITGDQTAIFTNGTAFNVTGSTGNDGAYTVSSSGFKILGTTIDAGGTGYTTGDILTVVGGTGTAATILVLSETGGVIDSVSIADSGLYSVPPTNPVSVTGGTGANATFNLVVDTNTTIVVNEDVLDNTPDGTISTPNITIFDINLTPEDFVIAGDQTATFVNGFTFEVIGSTGNDGTYTVFDSVFGTETTISVLEDIVDATIDGSISTTSFVITGVDEVAEDFVIAGDQTAIFTNGVIFQVVGSLSGNDGTYTVSSSVFGTETTITVQGDIPDANVAGSIYLFDYAITGVTLVPEDFIVAGDETTIFTNGTEFTVSGSTGNDGNYTVSSSVFGTETTITVIENIASSIIDGSIDGFPVDYTFDISVNSQASVEVVIPGTFTNRLGDVVIAINALADLNYHDSGVPDPKWAFGATMLDGKMIFTSSLPGTGSKIDLTDGSTNPLFGGMAGDIFDTGIFTIDLPLSNGAENDYPPFDASYDEIGRIGRKSQLFQFIGATIPQAGSTIEVITEPDIFAEQL